MADFDINAFLAKFQADQEAANQAGLTRWGNLMKTGGNIRNRALGKGGYYDQMGANQAKMGGTARRLIGDAETQNLAGAEQDLMDRGLGNTTIRSSVRRGVQSDATNQRAALEESLAAGENQVLGQRAGADMEIGRFMTDLGLSRNDIGPDIGQYLSLIQSLGSTGSLPGAMATNAGGTGGGGGRSHNFVGGVPSGSTPFGQSTGGGGANTTGGVQTFTNPNPGGHNIPAANSSTRRSISWGARNGIPWGTAIPRYA